MSLPRKPEDYGRVAVFLGGWSAEREISLLSGAEVCHGLTRAGIDIAPIDVSRESLAALKPTDFDRVFNILHGAGGEDGVIQGYLEVLSLPYTGSDVKASALTMDKILSKQIWQQQSLPTPKFEEISAGSDWSALVARLGLPLFIKPVTEGSSIGMTRVEQLADLPQACAAAAMHGQRVIAEQFIAGPEFTVAILDGSALPAIRLETPHNFYDFSAKYQAGDTQYHCPCGLDASTEAALGSLSLAAFNAVGASGWGRVDVMQDQSGQFWLLEVNTTPGMTAHSLVPKAAAVAGMDFETLVLRILDTSFNVTGERDGA